MICDPGDIPDTESVEIKKILMKNGVEILDLSGANAQAYKWMHLIQRYPFDLVFISSHAGEVNGRRIKSKIVSCKGMSHEFVYDLYASFAPVPYEDNVVVTELVVPISVDGISWCDKKRLKEHEKARHFDLHEFIHDIKHNDDREEVLTTEDCKGIKFSNALQLYRFTWIPAIHVLGETRFPIVFNNACSSWIEMAGRFIFTGASVYIGTTKDIQTTLARDCGIKFIKIAIQGNSLSHALYQAQNEFILQLGYSPYLYWGHPDIQMKPSISTNCRVLRQKRVQTTLVGLYQKLERVTDEYMKKEIRASIECISDVS